MLITIEGIDGAGKTTVYRALEEEFPNAVYTTEPDDTTLYGLAVREAIKDDSTPALATFFAFLADHANHLFTKVQPLLETDTLVVCDRYSDSRYAYQSHALQDIVANPEQTLTQLEDEFAESSYPEVSFREAAARYSPPEALFFAYLARVANGGDEGLHPHLQSGSETVNLQGAIDGPLEDAVRDPYAWLASLRQYEDSLAWVRHIQEYNQWSRQPDLTLLLDIPVEVSFERKSGDKKETFEKRDFLEGVRKNYLSLKDAFDDRYRKVVATKEPDVVTDICVENVKRAVATSDP